MSILNKAEMMRKRFVSKQLGKSGGDILGVDSGLYYTCVASNIQLANANSFLIEQDNFEKIIELDENQTGFNEIQLQNIFTTTNSFANECLANISESNKIINSIQIYRLPIEEDFSQRKIIIEIRIGRTNLNEEKYSLYKTTPIIYFRNVDNYRYNYNGGECSQLYSLDFDWTGARGGQVISDMGTQGYTTGGAKVLEQAINVTYNARLPRLNGSYQLAHPGVKYIFLPVEFHGSNLQPWNFKTTNFAQNPFLSVNHSPTRIFSYNDWTNPNTQSHLNVCLSGNMLNYYLNESMDIIDQTTTPTLLGSGYSFYSLQIRSAAAGYGFIPPYPSDKRLIALNSVPYNWGNSTTDYYEYYKHYYTLFKAKMITVANPDQM